MRAGTSALIGILLFFLASARAPAEEAGRRYTETRGGRDRAVEYGVVRDAAGFLVSSVAPGSGEKGRWTAGIGLVSWQQKDDELDNDLSGVRAGNTIHLSGMLHGKPVEKEIRIDSAPWYQIFGPAMTDLLPAGVSQREFWVVNPADLSAHKMQVRRAGSETVKVNGAAVDAMRVHFSPGALSPFWGADFWYRASDGVWVYSRLPEDGVLTVTTIDETGT